MIENKVILSNFRDDFILKYQAAHKAKLSKEQLAEYLGMLPKSLMRRKQEVKQELGLELAELHTDPNVPFVKVSKKFFEELDKLLEKIKPHQIVNSPEHQVKFDIQANKTYIITSAQNATPIHEKFFDALKNYCDYNDAQLLIVPYRYTNPTSVYTLAQKKNEWWIPAIREYMTDEELKLGKHVRVMGTTKIVPTATRPLSGFDTVSGLDSAIFGHPKVEMRVVPAVSGKMPKTLMTTGSITVQNYTDTKAGKKGSLHHTFGAVVLEVGEDDMFHFRHITADPVTGEFYDLDKLYTQKSVVEGQTALALYAGDSHAEVIDVNVKKALYTDHDSIANVLRPEKMIFGDILDFKVRSHHTIKDALGRFKKHHSGKHDNVEYDLQLVADFLDEVSKPGTENIIVKSNHDEHLERWLKESDPKTDPENAQFYYYMQYHQYKAAKNGEHFDALAFWMKNPDEQAGLRHDNTRFLQRDESCEISALELSLHGDVGPNGSRGSLANLSKMGQRVIIGHSHTPGIMDGSYQVGTSTGRLEYNKGPSSWLNTSAIIYPDGNVTLLNVINGKWKKGA